MDKGGGTDGTLYGYSNLTQICCISRTQSSVPYSSKTLPRLYLNDIDSIPCCTSSIESMFRHVYETRRDALLAPDHALAVGAPDLASRPPFQVSHILVHEVTRRITLLDLENSQTYPPHELALMVSAMVHARPDFVLEWGTNIGVSSRVFVEAAEMLGLATQVHTFDVKTQQKTGSTGWVANARKCQGNEEREYFKEYKIFGKPCVHMHIGDGLDGAFAVYEAEAWAAARVLWFVDGDHSYEAVARELFSIAGHASCQRPSFSSSSDADDSQGSSDILDSRWSWKGDGCYILCHDVFADSIPCDERGCPEPGVGAAIRQFLASHSHRFARIDAVFSNPGMTLLYPL
eukprot:Tamp_04379.p1 GENE.Tamp_04379~~Tamp_04379.p1  ORF type:complete len:346 (+),score=24.92 Tamp_04379:2179-3216(+)